MQSGRIDAGCIFRAVALIALVLGGGFLLLVAIGSMVAPRYEGTIDPWSPAPTYLPAVVPPDSTQAPTLTFQPSPTPTPRPTPTPAPAATPKPKPLPRIGDKVSSGDGWWVRVDKVERWRPSWYREPGWRLISAYVTVGMPAVENEFVWGDMFFVTAPSGREYQGGLVDGREPRLFAWSDYHRPTQAKGWVTFEVRDKDAAGLVLTSCVPELFGCDDGPRIRLAR